MSQVLPNPPSSCECSCGQPTSVTPGQGPPGPPGPAGADGADGTVGSDGVNAFTLTTADFVMPPEQGNVTIPVVNSEWFAIGQHVFAQGAGFMSVLSVPNSLSVQLRNLRNTPLSKYLDNVAPGTVIGSGAKLSPGGVQGPAGETGDSASALATFLVRDATDIPANAVNLGALPAGTYLLKQTVAAGVASFAQGIAGSDYLTALNAILFKTATNSTLVNGANSSINFGDNVVIRLTPGPTAAFSIHGIAGAAGGKFHILFNLTGQDWTIHNESGGEALAAQRIITVDGSNLTAPSYSICLLIYDSTTQRWRVILFA